jgi:methionyl-tRNA formyltransferase
MNITILSNRDLASNYALNQLLPALHGHRLTVYLSSRVGKAGPMPKGLRDLRFIEQSLFNQLFMPLLKQQRPDSGYSAGVGQPSTTMPATSRANMNAVAPSNSAMSLLSFDALAAYLETPITGFNDINSATGLARLRASEPALIISLRYGVILKEAAIRVPAFGVINLHSGLLPNYRGVMASFWGLLNSETQLGTTLHYIEDDGIDTGRIIDTTALSVKPEHSYLWHVLNLYPAGCAMIAATVARLANSEPIASQPQAADGSYYTFPTETDLARFSQQGLMLFDGDELITFLQRYLFTIPPRP